MGKISRVLRSAEGAGLLFHCPGCNNLHQVKVGNGAGPRWSWDGNAGAPTFTPSVLVTLDQWVPSADDPEVCAKILSGEVVQTIEKRVCHSFVRGGRIEFLSDCTHALAGQTVDLPEVA